MPTRLSAPSAPVATALAAPRSADARGALALRDETDRSGERQWAIAGTGMAIVEQPATIVPGTAPSPRPQRSLSFQSETAQKAMRSLGVGASQCFTQLRVPSKLNRDPGGGTSIDVQAHMRLSCRY